MIPYSHQSIDQEDIEAVVDVLKSDYLTQGDRVPALEKKLSAYCGADHAIATSSATAALHAACLALGLGKGDLLWTSAISFVASANCAHYCGANIDFIDIDSKTANLSLDDLCEKLEAAVKADEKLPKVLVVVHMAGHPIDLEKIYRLSRKYGFFVVEDAAHALGARYDQSAVGCCKYSDICIFSFHPLKSITTGEGGMALTNNSDYARKMRLYANHGIERDYSAFLDKDKPAWYYEQVVLGYNYRLSDIHAALGLTQLSKLNDFISKRQKIANNYIRMLKNLPIKLPVEPDQCKSSWHLFNIRISSPGQTNVRDQVYSFMREKGIGVQLHYIPIYRQPYFSKFNFLTENYPNAELYYAENLTLPCFPDLGNEKQKYIVKNLVEALNNFCKSYSK